MGLAWRLPPEPTFEDFFLFLPKEKIDSPHSSQIATIERSERALQKSNCNTSEAHDLLNAHLTQLHQAMADLQLIDEQMFPETFPLDAVLDRGSSAPFTPRSAG